MPHRAVALKVALPVPVPRLFDYRAPHGHALDQIQRGQRVRVPFGKRELTGIVEAVGAVEATGEIRAARSLPDPGMPLLHGELLASLGWLARYTHLPLGEVYASALPAALRRGEPLPDTRCWVWQLTQAGVTAASGLRRGSRPARLAELLRQAALSEDVLDAELPQWRTAARALAKRGLAQRVAHAAQRGAQACDSTSSRVQIASPTPNPEQAAAIAEISAADGFTPYLLDGVTGSGKTEVYLHAIADCLNRGKQALVLVPEIGLTPQLLARFQARLGVAVHATHSGLSDNERARVWAAAWRNEARVVVGTRSAVFTPLPEGGLIVVDEEHDASYKQQDGIRYHARDFALWRAKALAIPIVLGSATPSLESLHNAGSGRYLHLRLTHRAGLALPPQVRVLDIRKRPLQAGLSAEALAGIAAALEAGGQVLVFKNRRGYAPVLLCHDCGWSAHCLRCGTSERDSAMTVHAGGRRLQCHHCGARRPSPAACPDCASLALQPQGIGTERLEELLSERFSGVPVVRVDAGSTRRKDGLLRAMAVLGDAPGILVGTQMLAKGHDLPRLTLVCVVGIDEGLFSADIRAHEKLAQLLIQVAGRAGRAERLGAVLLQTHHPEHPLLQTLLTGGYHAFASAELAARAAADLPPFAHWALLRAESAGSEAASAFLRAAQQLLNQTKPMQSASNDAATQLQTSGPWPAPMPRRAGLHRAQLLLTSASRKSLHGALSQTVGAWYALPQARKVRWSLDVDPIDLY